MPYCENLFHSVPHCNGVHVSEFSGKLLKLLPHADVLF